MNTTAARLALLSVVSLFLLLATALPSFAQQGSAHGARLGHGARSPFGLPSPASDQDFRTASAAEIELGRLLFFDKILSGNRDVSCATCHHPLLHTGDGLSLPLGAAAKGLSVTRSAGDTATGVGERVPRNSPAIFNLGAFEFTTMFHDGRVAIDPTQPSGFVSPAGDDLPSGLSGPLAVQAMFPPTSTTEMAGRPGENSVADAAHAGDLAGPNGVWALLASRLSDIPEYVELFQAAFDDVDGPDDIAFVHAANAIAAFEASAWRADDSPFDRFLRGDPQAMSRDARGGMRLFYGKARCSSCHTGIFQTDHAFHCLAMPQLGPGKGDGPDGHEDFGRMRVTGDPGDRHRFRTPSLRNVALTAPYGHTGAYADLERVVRHHLDPSGALESYETAQATLPPRPDLDALDFVVYNDPARRAEIAAGNEMPVVSLSEEEIRVLIEFLRALTDPGSIDRRGDVPMRVPSGDPVAD